MQGSAVEEGRGRGGEEEAGEQLVELDGALVLLGTLVEGETEADAHPEELGRLDATAADVDQVAVVDGLKSHVVELEVALGLEGRGDLLDVVTEQVGGESSGGDTLLDVGLEAGSMGHGDVVVVLEAGKGLAVDGLEKQAGRDEAVGGVELDAGLGRKDHGLLDLVDADAVVEVPHGLVGHLAGLAAVLESAAGADQGAADALGLEDLLAAVTEDDVELCLDVTGQVAVSAEGAGLAAVLTVNDVAAGHLGVPLDHEGLLDGILDALDLELLATDGAAEEALDDGGGDRKCGGLILGREGVIAGDVAVGLEGALDGETDALLVEGFATAITLAHGEFTALKRVDPVEGELS